MTAGFSWWFLHGGSRLRFMVLILFFVSLDKTSSSVADTVRSVFHRFFAFYGCSIKAANHDFVRNI